MPTTARPRPRRFTIIDGMILVAPLAVAMLGWREFLVSYRTLMGRSPSTPSESLFVSLDASIASMAFGTMAGLILVRLRRPRPGRRGLMRQPGFVACTAAMATIAFGWLFGLSLYLFRTPGWGYWPFQQLCAVSMGMTAWGVVGAWLILAITGRWKAEPGWIDRTGRLLGVIVVGWTLTIEVYHLFGR